MREAILEKASELNRNPLQCLAEVQGLVRELSAHIDGTRKINGAEIDRNITRLTAYTLGVPVSIPLNSNTLFTRAVKYTEDDGGTFYTETSRLSYIPLASAKKAKQNRLNKAEEPVFYASLDTQSDSIATVLAEINAKKGDVVNVLYSVTCGDALGALHVIPIGVMEYFRQGKPLPFGLHPTFKEIYELMRQSAHPDAMEAVHLCDRFLNSILTAKTEEENPPLYDVTSSLAKDFFAAQPLDGILYQSTKYANFPNVALKTTSVDNKLRISGAAAYRVVDVASTAPFVLQHLGDGIVEGDQIIWLPKA